MSTYNCRGVINGIIVQNNPVNWIDPEGLANVGPKTGSPFGMGGGGISRSGGGGGRGIGIRGACGKKPAKKGVKKLSDGEIKKMKKKLDIHDLKPNSKHDLFKDGKGNIESRPKSGIGPGDPTGFNINDF